MTEKKKSTKKATTEPPIPKEQNSGVGRVIVGGSLPPDHPIFSRGPMIFGRNLPPEPKKTPEKKGGSQS